MILINTENNETKIKVTKTNLLKIKKEIIKGEILMELTNSLDNKFLVMLLKFLKSKKLSTEYYW